MSAAFAALSAPATARVAPRANGARRSRAPLSVRAQAVVEPAAAVNEQARDDVRNIAIIAHVDHGKTTLVGPYKKAWRVLLAQLDPAYPWSNRNPPSATIQSCSS
jgi:hypothetical protein